MIFVPMISLKVTFDLRIGPDDRYHILRAEKIISAKPARGVSSSGTA